MKTDHSSLQSTFNNLTLENNDLKVSGLYIYCDLYIEKLFLISSLNIKKCLFYYDIIIAQKRKFFFLNSIVKDSIFFTCPLLRITTYSILSNISFSILLKIKNCSFFNINYSFKHWHYNYVHGIIRYFSIEENLDVNLVLENNYFNNIIFEKIEKGVGNTFMFANFNKGIIKNLTIYFLDNSFGLMFIANYPFSDIIIQNIYLNIKSYMIFAGIFFTETSFRSILLEDSSLIIGKTILGLLQINTVNFIEIKNLFIKGDSSSGTFLVQINGVNLMKKILIKNSTFILKIHSSLGKVSIIRFKLTENILLKNKSDIFLNNSPIIEFGIIQCSFYNATNSMISLTSGSMYFYDCVFFNSSNQLTGGIFFIKEKTSLILIKCLINKTKSNEFGGSIFISQESFAIIINVRIIESKNYFGFGGVFYLLNCKILIKNSIFINLFAKFGGFILSENSEINLTSSKIIVSKVEIDGGLFFSKLGKILIIECEVSEAISKSNNK